MGGGGGLGLFIGTAGCREINALSGGRMVAAAGQVSTATDAGGGVTDSANTTAKNAKKTSGWWLFLPYGHPEKTKKIEQIQGDLRPLLEGFARSFLGVDKRDPKSWIITEGSKALSKKLRKNKQKK